MNYILNVLKNLGGILVYLTISILITNTIRYIAPILIVKGWMAYFLTVFIVGIVEALISLTLTFFSMLLLHLIDMRFSKYFCILVSIVCLIYSIIIPWQFLSVYGFSFIGLIWTLTFSFAIVMTYYLFVVYIFMKPSKKK